MAPPKQQRTRAFMGKGLPKVSLKNLTGFFVSIDGAECSGCSTQVKLLRETFERAGYPTMQVGLGSSDFLGSELQELLKNHFLARHTLSLFQATDLADQVENKIIPALRAGFVVIADRYCLSGMFRAAVRGIEASWINETYGFALRPDLSIVLSVEPEVLARRCFSKYGSLGFWESGRDSFVAPDLYGGFLSYQEAQVSVMKKFSRLHKAVVIAADRSAEWVYARIAAHVDRAHGRLPRLNL